jgi:hypothetical protein
MRRLSFLGGTEINNKTVPFFIGIAGKKNMQIPPQHQGKQKWEKHLSFFSKPIVLEDDGCHDVSQVIEKIEDSDSLLSATQFTPTNQRVYFKKPRHGMILACTLAEMPFCEAAAGAQIIPTQITGISVPVKTTADNISNEIPGTNCRQGY